MREVFREYGGTVIAVFVLLLLFFLVFGKLEWKGNTGFLHILGQGTGIEGKNFAEYQDSQNTVQVMEQKRPVINYADIQIQTGDVLHKDTLFMATDADGNPAETKIFKVLNPVGSEVAQTGGYIKFELQGIYQFWVRATDRNCGVTEQVYEIPVRHR